MFQWTLDLGNFTSTKDDVVYIEVDYMTPIILYATDLENVPDSIELMTDLPQFNSFDSSSQGSTQHLCFMERDMGKTSSKIFGPPNAGPPAQTDNVLDSDLWQIWRFTQKPARIPVRPEVLQQKRWTLGLFFTGEEAGRQDKTVLEDFDGSYVQMNRPKLVLSVTK